MSRGSNGVYSVPSGTTAVPGQTITSSPYNAFTADVAQAITDSLDRTGRGGMTATLAMGNHQITGLSPATAAGMAVEYAQMQSAFPFTNITSTNLTANGAAGTVRGLQIQSGGLNRIVIAADGSAETGSNAGSNLVFKIYADDGVTVLSTFTANRATGVFDFPALPTYNGGNPLVLPGTVVPTGAIIDFPMYAAPANFLALSGQLISRGTYAALWTFANASGNIVADATWTGGAGTYDGAFSLGDGTTTFRLPDYRGNFRRSWDNARGIDAARAIGSMQLDAFQGHQHSHTSLTTQAAGYSNGFAAAGSGVAATVISPEGNPITDGTNGTPRTAAETRPRNVAAISCIKT